MHRTVGSILLTFVFFYCGRAWINGIQSKYLSNLASFVQTKSFRVKEHFEYVDQLFVLKQLLRFKILLYLFFFSQIYESAKAIFFYSLNFKNETGVVLRLYGQVS